MFLIDVEQENVQNILRNVRLRPSVLTKKKLKNANKNHPEHFPSALINCIKDLS